MERPPNTLVLGIIQPEDAPALLDALTGAGCGATTLAARGGFLRRGAVAVFTLVPTDRVPAVLAAARATCRRRTALLVPMFEPDAGMVVAPLDVEIGGAVLFGLPATLSTRWGTGPPRGGTVAGPRSPWTFIVETDAEGEEAPLPDTTPATLIIAVVSDRAADRVVEALVAQQFGATLIGSTGGFLRRGNATILTGVPDDRAAAAAAIIRDACASGADVARGGGGIAIAVPVVWQVRL